MTDADDPSHPLYPAFDDENPQPECYVVYYKGISGRWLATSPFYQEENAIWAASHYDCEVKIAKYDLSSARYIPLEERKSYRNKKHAVKREVKVLMPKIKQPIKVRMPKKPIQASLELEE